MSGVKYGFGFTALQVGPRRGTTLIELVWVVAVVGLLTVIALPSAGRIHDRLVTRRAATDAMSFYHRARYTGMMRSRRVRLEFAADTHRAYFEAATDSLFLVVPGPMHDRVNLQVSRSTIRIQPNGIGWGAANTKLVFRRGSAAESLTTSRLGRLRMW